MLLFWVAAAALSLAAAGLIVRGARRAPAKPGDADPTTVLYERQLDEIDEMVDRGLLSEAERRSARAEAARRLLSAADRGPDTPSQGGLKPPVAIGAALAVVLLGAVTYVGIGAPGLADQPYLSRVKTWRETDPRTLDPSQMAAVLKGIVAERPGDVQALRFLAQAQIASNDPFGAEDSIRKALAVAPERAELWMLLGAALTAETDGKTNADAREAFEQAVKRDPRSPTIRYFAGRARIEGGAAEQGLVLWRSLLDELPPASAEHASMAADIAAVERTGRLPVPVEQQAGGAEMQGAIRGMVDGLAARLAANPDDADGWIRLVRSYSVLGETAKRDQALATAQARFKDRPEVLSGLAEAAKAP